jgi:cysteine-rich repeat protein
MARASLLVAALVLTLFASITAQAHDTRLPVAADELKIKPVGIGSGVQFSFTGQEPILLGHDPRTHDTAVLVYGTGENADSTGRLELDRNLWSPEMDPGPAISGYSYSDPSGPIESATLRQGELSVTGSTADWPWTPAGSVDELWFWFVIEEEWFCAEADVQTAGQMTANQQGNVRFLDTTAPASCPDRVCGNGIREIGELCDDGNRVEDDGCSNDCQSDICTTADFDSTYAGIQSVIFDAAVYQCTNGACHSSVAASGGLDLTAGASYDQLVGVPSSIASADGVTILDRVEPSEPIASFLYEKLSAKTFGTPTGGTPMPSFPTPLTPDHLEAIEKWIRAGAPRDLVVAETAPLLGTCLPPEDPLKLDPPPAAPPAGEGIQLRSTAWELPTNSEDEICYATYYDFRGLISEEDLLACGDFGGVNNPSGQCFYYNRRILRQDAQSHHSIIQIYNGLTGLSDASDPFGPFTYKPNYPGEPGAPSGPCDPLAIDPATGWNPDCSGVIVSGVACGNYPVVDVATNAPSFAGSQEPYTDDHYYEGVYSVLPQTGVVIWNSHAFNLSSGDTTMAQYLDMYFGDPTKRDYPVRGIFDISKIFIQEVPPFETREYCKTFTVAAAFDIVEDIQITELGSHTHRHGTRFRTWGPPNEPCDPGGPIVFSCESQPGGCNCGPGDPSQLLYFSTTYTDPVALQFDPPMSLGTSVAERTFLYCSLYDNGSTPDSPPVKRQSESPPPPPGGFAGLTIGGPCPDVDEPYIGGAFGTLHGVACMDGPNQGVKCGAQANPAQFCETSAFANDGDCDACTAMGGFTTEDEMFILTGTFFIPEPSSSALAVAALATLAALRARKRKQRA